MKQQNTQLTAAPGRRRQPERAWGKALSLLALASLLGCRQDAKTTADVPEPKVDGNTVVFPENAPQMSSLDVETAQPRKIEITHLTGRLYWDDDVTVRVFTPVSGRVTAVKADLGDVISVGAPLAEIDSPDFGQALANAQTAAGNLMAAQKTFDRTRELFEHGAAAQKDVEAAQAACIAAQAERDRAESVLANYGGHDNETNELYNLKSPLAGVLVEKNINPGQEVRADQMLANAPNLIAPLFVVSDPAKLWLQVDVAESDLPSLQPGQTLTIHCRAYPDKIFEGHIGKIGDELDASTRTVKVRGYVDNPDRLLKAEMYVMVDLADAGTNTAEAGVEIPAKAIFMKNNESYLFIEQSPGQFERQKVKVGVEKDGEVPVIEGVAAGQKVVTEGCLLLQALVDPAS